MLKNRHISFLTWLFSSIMLLMTAACSSSDDEGEQEGVAAKKPVMLAIYVYAPEQTSAKKHAAPTRGQSRGHMSVILIQKMVNSLL